MKRIQVAGLMLLLVAALAPAQAALPKNSKPLAGYSEIRVEKFTVENNGKTGDFPRGEEIAIQQNAVRRLMDSDLFAVVTDDQEQPGVKPASASAQGRSAKRLILSGTVIKYDKGSRAARYFIGLGAGKTSVKVRFVIHDAESGQELLRKDCKGSFTGWIAFFGGSRDQATHEAAGDVVDGLLRAIKKNR